MEAGKTRISGLYLRGYLAGLRKITGNQYSKILNVAGLGEYVDKYPPATDAPVATGQHLALMHEAIAQAVSAELHDMFLRNLGRSFAQNAINTPGLKEAITRLGPVKSDRVLLYKALRLIVGVMDKTILDGQALLESDNSDDPAKGTWCIVYINCMNCVHRSRGTTPTCSAIPAFYKEVILGLTGVRVQVEEIACGGDSDQTCRYLLTLPKSL